jgi:hypothetical protein
MIPTQDTHDTLAYLRTNAEAFYQKAWGKPWPHQSQGFISKTDIVPAGNGTPKGTALDDNDDFGQLNDNMDNTYGGIPDDLDIPDKFEYLCLQEMEAVAKTLDLGVAIIDTLVVRDEYELLRKTIETGYLQNVHAIVVMGHQGIGSSCGLFWIGVEF